MALECRIHGNLLTERSLLKDGWVGGRGLVEVWRTRYIIRVYGLLGIGDDPNNAKAVYFHMTRFALYPSPDLVSVVCSGHCDVCSSRLKLWTFRQLFSCIGNYQ